MNSLLECRATIRHPPIPSAGARNAVGIVSQSGNLGIALAQGVERGRRSAA